MSSTGFTVLAMMLPPVDGEVDGDKDPGGCGPVRGRTKLSTIGLRPGSGVVLMVISDKSGHDVVPD